jgi:hypothetical protein
VVQTEVVEVVVTVVVFKTPTNIVDQTVEVVVVVVYSVDVAEVPMARGAESSTTSVIARIATPSIIMTFASSAILVLFTCAHPS